MLNIFAEFDVVAIELFKSLVQGLVTELTSLDKSGLLHLYIQNFGTNLIRTCLQNDQ
jgi:hypothetical protein